jgi:hypothetical protein
LENKNGDHSKPRSFKDITGLGVSHFKALYSKWNKVKIVEIVKITSSFPNFIDEEENELLKDEVSKE